MRVAWPALLSHVAIIVPNVFLITKSPSVLTQRHPYATLLSLLLLLQATLFLLLLLLLLQATLVLLLLVPV